MQPGALPADVRGDTGSRHGQAVALADPGAAGVGARPARLCGVATARRVMAVEAVAEDAGAFVADERVLTPPAASVGRRIQGSEVAQSAEPIGWRSHPRRSVAVHRTAEIGEPTEDLMETATIHSV